MVTYHTKYKYTTDIICFLGDFMDISYIKQSVNNIQHDHDYCIAAKGLMNEKYADVNRTIIKDASTDQLDKDVSLPTFGIFF